MDPELLRLLTGGWDAGLPQAPPPAAPPPPQPTTGPRGVEALPPNAPYWDNLRTPGQMTPAADPVADAQSAWEFIKRVYGAWETFPKPGPNVQNLPLEVQAPPPSPYPTEPPIQSLEGQAPVPQPAPPVTSAEVLLSEARRKAGEGLPPSSSSPAGPPAGAAAGSAAGTAIGAAPFPPAPLPSAVMAGIGEQPSAPPETTRRTPAGTAAGILPQPPTAVPGAGSPPSGGGGPPGGGAAPQGGVGAPPPGGTPPAGAAPPGKASMDPAFWRSLGVIGLTLMQPVRPGSNWLGHIGDALGAGLAHQMMSESATQTRDIAERKVAVEERRAEATVGRTKAETTRTLAELPGDLRLQAARLAQIREAITSSADVRESRKLQREATSLENDLTRRFGADKVQAAIDLQKAQTAAAVETPQQKQQRLMLDAIKIATVPDPANPLTTRVDVRRLKQILAATPGMPQLPPLPPASIEGGRARLKGLTKGTPKYEQAVQQLNDTALANGYLPPDEW